MIGKSLTSLLLVVFCGTTAVAQSESASLQFNFLNIEGFTVGVPFALDDAYEQTAGRPIPARLKMFIPMAKSKYQVLVDNQPSGGMVKIAFATLDRVLIDSLHIINATIPMQAMDQRLSIFAAMLKDTAYPVSVQGMENGELVALRNYQMGDYAAVELIATYTDPALGPMYLRILGVPHPDKAESIFVIMNINAKLEPLDDLDQFPETLSGRAADSITFTK